MIKGSKIVKFFTLLVGFMPWVFADTVKVATNDWKPYNTVDGQGLVDIVVREAFALVGHEVEYVILPWKRAYETVKSGENDVSYPWSFLPEREKEVLFNETPIIVNRSIFWHKKDTDFSWSDTSDLKKYKIGAMIGYSDTDILESAGVPVQKVSDEKTNLKKLLSGRIDAFAMNEVVGHMIVKENLTAQESEQLTTFGDKALVESKMHAIFPKSERGEKLAADFEKGFKQLIESGRYKEILFS